MRIESIRLKGVGPFDDTTIEFPAGTDERLADTYLLVGQNGCGKTTVLHAAVAALSLGLNSSVKFGPRAWDIDSFVHLKADTLQFVVGKSDGGSGGAERMTNLASRFGFEPSRIGGTETELVASSEVLNGNSDWARWCTGLQNGWTRSRWGAFTYSGARTFDRVGVSAINDSRFPAFTDALSFHGTANTQRLVQWLANQDYRRMKLRESGRNADADAVLEGSRRISSAISEVIGETFAFDIAPERLTPRVRLGARLLDFDLLPDGLKSIASWVSDLLMRLSAEDGWATNVPPHEREFLLLLDEIDIHLHPAWQRSLLPVVQKIFPKAQIIASTHSPFVVASLRDGAVIELKIDDQGRSTAQPALRPGPGANGHQLSVNYGTLMRNLFGIHSDFDLEVERGFIELQNTARRIMKGEAGLEGTLRDQAAKLHAFGSEELSIRVQMEVNQAGRK